MCTTWQHYRPGFVGFAATEKQDSNIRLNLNDFLRHHAMRFAMYLHRCLGVWCFTKAKDLASFLVDPVLVVMNAIFALHFGIMLVSLSHIRFSNSAGNFVNVDVFWHRITPSRRILSRGKLRLNVDLSRTVQCLINNAVALR